MFLAAVGTSGTRRPLSAAAGGVCSNHLADHGPSQTGGAAASAPGDRHTATVALKRRLAAASDTDTDVLDVVIAISYYLCSLRPTPPTPTPFSRCFLRPAAAPTWSCGSRPCSDTKAPCWSVLELHTHTDCIP